MTIVAFGKGSVRQDYHLCSGHSIDLFVLNFGEAYHYDEYPLINVTLTLSPS